MIEEREYNSVVKYASIKEIILLDTNTPLIVVLCPNYEDRTQAIAKDIESVFKQAHRPIYYLLVCLKNKKNNDMILEDLKETNIEEIMRNLNIPEENCVWIDYPNNFSSNALKSPIENILENALRYDTYVDKEKIVSLFRDFEKPSYHVIGNHDCDMCTKEELLGNYGVEHGPYYSFDMGGFHFIVLDPNYYIIDGICHSFENGNYFDESYHPERGRNPALRRSCRRSQRLPDHW